MPKIFRATCENGIVSIEGEIVDGVEVLSEGVADSEGILVLDESEATYLPSSATDIKDLITSLGEILEKVVTILTGIDTVTNSPGSQSANIVLLAALRTELVLTKDLLK